MPDLTIPDIEIKIFPASAIPYRNRPGFVIADCLGDLVNLGMGDSQGVRLQATNPTITDDWLNPGLATGQWSAMQGVSWIRFLSDGTFREGASAKKQGDADELFGFIIAPRIGYLDSKISSTPLDGGYTDLNWEATQGTWESVKPPGAPTFLKIRPTGSGATHKAQTVGNLPANRSQFVSVDFSSMGKKSTQGGFRYRFGGSGEFSLSLVAREGQKWTVEQKIAGVDRVIRCLDTAPVNMRGGHYDIWIRRIAGRLCVNINDQRFHMIFLDPAGKPGDASWIAGKVYVNTFNVRATVGVGLIKYAETDDTPFTATFGRLLHRSVPVRTDESTTLPLVKFRGWSRGNTSLSGTVELSTLAVTYTVTMTASAAGIDTPFCSHVQVRFNPEWNNLTPSGVELRPALKRMRVALPFLPSSPSSEASIELDRELLDSQVPGWEDAVERYMPISIRARRKYTDGTYADATWRHLFKGYVIKVDGATEGFNASTVTLTCRDPLFRLQKPAGFIDQRYPPHDLIFAYSEDQKFWGYQGVAEILNMTLGQAEGARLATYFPASHYALIDATSDTGGFLNVQSLVTGQPPTQGAFFFPAPYRQNAYNWIEKYMEFDHAVFFYGFPDGDTTDWPAPIYGRIPSILATMNAETIPDAISVGGADALLNLMTQIRTETRPDRDINRVWAGANPPGGQTNDFTPALRMATAQLGGSNPNRPELSWERTLDASSDYGFFEEGVEAIVFGMVDLLGTTVFKWPQFLMRGNPDLHWGTKCTFQLVTDTTNTVLSLDNQTFRAEQVEHIFDLGTGEADTWTTSVHARPLSRGVF